jgi:chromosome segregation ATPase
LEQSKNSLWQNESGVRPTAQSVSGKITRLENDLQLAREDLRSSRQTLLLEQERSNSMLRSVTNELERTRKDLDSARTATTTSKADSMRLASLERELNQARRALQMAQMAPMDSTKESYLTLQDELRKALGEITRMQVELNEKDELEAQLVKLRSSMEDFGDSPSRSASPEYVNKLLIDLNAAKREVEKAKSLNRAGRQDLVERVASLENELKISNIALKKTQAEFDASQEKIARREFEYASTIQRLEEDAQMAQNSLRDASLGKLPAIPFVDEMERNLADSEARIQTLSARFEAEQSKATELIEGLQVELDAAVVRQKRALDQLAKREIELEGKDLELKQAKEDTKKLKEELEVVKVIAGQLEDLNTVLEQTKRTQSSQSGTLDQTVESLREELNQAKVELVFALEDNEQFKQDSAKIISSLELQLENTRNDLLAEQENQADQANESKELVLDLKSELDLARSEISRMKTAGLGDSVETKQAVSQLQEALGTIRILQESLEQSEKVNLEVDNLRTELANTMESQLFELQRADDEKNVLRKQSEDLESEIALLRNQGLGAGVQFQKSNAALMEELEVSKSRIVELEKRAAMTEDSEVLSLIDLEEELAGEKIRNQELQQELSQKVMGKSKTVELLESELADALKKLDDIELQDNEREERIASLEKEILQTKSLIESQPEDESAMDANQIAMVSQLEEQLMEAQNRLSKLESMPEDSPNDGRQDGEAIQKLENDLAQAEQTIAALQVSLDSQDKMRDDLQTQLDEAINKLDELAQVPNVPVVRDHSPELDEAEDFIRMENELLDAQKTIDELIAKTKSEEMERLNLESKLAVAMQNIDKIENSKPSDSIVEPIVDDTVVVEELKSLLDSKDKRLNELEEELSNAIVEMTEKEAELEIAAGIQEDMEILANKLANAERSLADINANQIEEPKDPPVPSISASERDVLEAEISQLKKELLAARTETPSTSQDNKILVELQQQLQDAVAESVEMQTELEETKSRLSLMESEPQDVSRSPELDKILLKAKQAEDQAMLRIGDLTTALRNSEELRKEMETLLVEADQQPKTVVESPNLASDPRFIELQKELLLLQQDLLSAREIEEPRVQALQLKLDASQNDSLRLNDEFKKAMQDFANFKEQVAILEEENRRLQKFASSPVSNQDREVRASLQNRVNDLSKENANLRMQVGERDNRVSGLREELARAQMTVPGIKPDNASLRAQIVRLEGVAQVARDGESRAKMDAQRSFGEVQALNQKISLLEESLRQAQSQSRGLPSSVPSYIPPQVVVSNTPNAADSAEILRLREQNQRLQDQLLASNTIPQRDQLDRKVRDLNQKNLTAQIQLDQERARVEDLRRQLSEARDIKQEVVERGQSANMKVSLLNNELSDAQNRIASLENALVAAREAIRVLKKGGGGSSTMKVSIPNTARRSSNYNSPISTMSVAPFSNRPLPSNYSTPRPLPSPTFRSSSPINKILPNSSLTSPGVQKIPEGDASIQLRAQVQFLNNKNRPAGFSEFFLVKNDLETLLSNSRVRIPSGQGIDSGAELWARSVQRGYRFPGVASAIRNALATNSLARIKTNSMGEANLANIEAGNYYIVGSSPLGQVGVVWSKQVQLKPGTNGVVLDLRDATWAE